MALLKPAVTGIAASFATLGYLSYYSYANNSLLKHKNIIPFGIAVLYSVFNVLIVKYRLNYILMGALLGLTLSFIGRFYLRMPTILFNFKTTNAFIVHPSAMVLYAAYFHFVVRFLNKYMKC